MGRITTATNGYKISRLNRNEITSLVRVPSLFARSMAPMIMKNTYPKMIMMLVMIEIVWAMS